MVEKYADVTYYRSNEGSFSEISDQDKSEILEILNSKRYAQRVIAPTEFCNSDLQPASKELEIEAEELFSRGEISEIACRFYPFNCHSLARKIKEKRGWMTVAGYLLRKEQLDSNSIVLTAHSVTQNEEGVLIELIDELFNLESYEFIKHRTGAFGTDLQAHKASTTQSF